MSMYLLNIVEFVRMRSRDLPKLRSFIQEWVDEYYNSRKNKVPRFYSHKRSNADVSVFGINGTYKEPDD